MTAAVKTPVVERMPHAGQRHPVRGVLAAIGEGTIGLLRPLIELSSLVVAVLWQGCRPLNWRRTSVKEFMRQCDLVGIGSLPFILLSGLLIGLAMVFQVLFWLKFLGQVSLAGKIIVLGLVREIAPLLVALIAIGRSGSVNMVELGHMRTSGQLRMLEAQGIDPFLFLIVPRCLATALSMFCLTVVFTLVALATGYLVGRVVLSTDTTVIEFINNVLGAMGVGEYAIIALKPLIAGLLITLITCTTGLSVGGPAGQLAEALPRGFVKSVLAVFLVSGTLTLLF
ncbi:MAG: ABC transporter permease [Desulfobacterales bacterium]|jgi:phospholipid/cholesterol/gamma-HCH transport system permease protein